EIVAQRQPLLVVILEREHAFVRPVLIRQELAKCIGIFNRRRFHRLEAVKLVDGADLLDHLPRGRGFARAAISEPARPAGVWLVRFLRFVGPTLGLSAISRW